MDTPPQTITEFSRRFFPDKFAWYQTHRRLCEGLHFTFVIGSLLYDSLKSGDEFRRLRVLDVGILLLTAIGRVAWFLTFKDPEVFLCFRRPGRGYLWAIRLVSLLTIVPNLGLHLVVLHANLQLSWNFGAGLLRAVLQPVLFLASCGIYFYFVWRFLLRRNHVLYEPVREPLMATRPGRGDGREDSVGSSAASVVSLRPYTDEEVDYDGNSNDEGASSLLYTAYRKACAEDAREPEETAGQNPTLDVPQEEDENEVTSPNHEASNLAPAPSLTGSTPPTRSTNRQKCPTLATYDYMPHNHTTTSSGVTYPIIIWLLGVYSIVLTFMIVNFALEDGKSRLPSPKAKYSLLSPIGSLLLCAYGTKHRLRKSLFREASMNLPLPWVQQKNRHGRLQQRFTNTETQTTTRRDPRLRVPVSDALKSRFRSRGVRSEYIRRYNANPSVCSEYWGHSGREATTRERVGPSLWRLLYIGASCLCFFAGAYSAFSYPSGPNGMEKYLGLPDVTAGDLRRFRRIMTMDLNICMAIAPLAILVGLYAMLAAFSVLAVLGREVIAMQERT